MTPVLQTIPSPCCVVQLTHDPHQVVLTLSLKEPFTGGKLVTVADDFQLAIQGTDDLSAGYGLANWLSAVTSGALHAFRALQIERRQVRLSRLTGKLGSSGLDALANGAAVAVATLSGKELPSVDLQGWVIHTEVSRPGNGTPTEGTPTQLPQAEQTPTQTS